MPAAETVAKVWQAYFAQKRLIEVICREFRVLWEVVRKAIRSPVAAAIGSERKQLGGLRFANEGRISRERGRTDGDATAAGKIIRCLV